MPRIEASTSWRDYENETLIHNHKMAKIYKKRYQRASDFENSLYRFFGLITVISSAVASTLAWGIGGTTGSFEGDDIDSQQQIVISSITTVSAISAAIQNFYKFQENANTNITTAKAYAKLQNKIESVGNIHPEYRLTKPNSFLKKIQDRFDQISDNRMELSNFLTKHLYSKEGDDESYLEMKHDRYNACQEEEKLDYAKNNHSSMNIQVDTDESGEDTHNY
tara:strand:+ start:6452 stop:7117 length:666 start_codon:yes stop_codon:yes gene_type:complete